MFYTVNEDIIVSGIDKVNVSLIPAIIAAGERFGVSVWIEDRSITETGEADIFCAAAGDDCEERIIDLGCYVHNTYGYDVA